ncbi:protein ANTAGONIST OF LIKE HETEROCHROMATIN PROTEIN 1-like isoform X2 [Xenia sp. Carnegie-2017]|uniref:protein ANTAGONIST OF LIKE HETEROCHROMATIN PROTEIN 1-like isoform X2 n=1 Tax=Xenia sp. Carnegie-2017 TaxID=2897299 RepID=UPI001F037155|nr:protein ANTAGONIST OF LIKE HETEROCHROMATIN PROTEIN 1-like isoform X2 [Xenia sp. Carnegie-2017]
MASKEERKLAILLLLRQRRKRRNKYKKRFWIEDILKRRKELGEYHRLIQEMRLNDPESFYQYFRMTPSRFDLLLGLVGPYLKKNSLYREPVSPEERLAVTLRFLATGDSQQSIAFSFRLGHGTVTKIVEESSEALWSALQPFIKPPTTTSEWKKIATDFWQLWNFPMCCGAIDGKHVVMQCPPRAGSSFLTIKEHIALFC